MLLKDQKANRQINILKNLFIRLGFFTIVAIEAAPCSQAKVVLIEGTQLA